MNTTRSCFPMTLRALGGLAAVLVLSSAMVLTACDSRSKASKQIKCDKLLDRGAWDQAITVCGAINTDDGHSKTAQAYMGRAGISLLDLADKVSGGSSAQGLALILGTFTVDATQFADVDAAIDQLLLVAARTDTDNFLLILASDIILASLLKDALGITVDATTGNITIPGITDTNLATLSATSTPGEIQTAFAGIYAATYYQTKPPAWDDPDPAVTDLVKISKYVQANQLGTTGFPLQSLSDLDFASQIDNGVCGLDPVQTASGVDNTADGPFAAAKFPRRLNTSEPSALYLANDLLFTLLNQSGAVDTAREWAGTFTLPSALLNPDFVGVNCGAGLAVGNFTACMASGAKLIGAFSAVTLADLTTPITCGGSCTDWPVLSNDLNPLTDDFTTQGPTAMAELAAVLHQLYPVDNNDPTPDTSGLHCAAGDGWVHAREYDYYLRTFGQ